MAVYKHSHGISWLFQKLMSLTLTYKVVQSIKDVFRYLTDMSYIADTLYSKEFFAVMKKYVHVNLKKDWIGRLYGIINPNIDINGKFDITDTIIEIDGDNTNNNEYVRHWIYKQMNLIDQLFKIHKLYDYISLEIAPVGPINGDNYLIILDVVSRKKMLTDMKKTGLQILFYAIIALIIFFVVF